MVKATLIVRQEGQPTQEVESGERETTIGAALDNTVCLEPGPGVANYHAVIVRRDDEHWLSDCGTRQGTRLNGERVLAERKLEDGDHITLGDACHIEFYRHDPATAPPETADSYSSTSARGSELGYYGASGAGSAVHTASSRASGRGADDAHVSHYIESDSTAAAPPAPDPTPSSSKVIVAGVLGAVLVTGAAALIFLDPFGGGGCRPSARIMTPLSGATLRSASTLRVEVGEKQCVRRISFQLDGEEVASASAEPYEAALDPRRLTRFAPGKHLLTATVETTDGSEIRQPGEVYVALESADGKRPTAPTPTPAEETNTASDAGAAAVTSTDVQDMSKQLASQISGKSGYVFEREMTARIRARTAEFESADPAALAAPYRPVILKAFGDRGVRPLLGFVLAMSRSKFDRASGEGGGIWRTPPAIARDYLPAGQAPDSPQREAEVSAFYLKELLGVFESDNFDLAVACYGCTLAEADEMRQRLSALPTSERRNFWRMVERGVVTQEQAERVVRFYAAGIVGENPKRFGASNDRSLSSLEY